MFVTLKVFKLIGLSNDGRRHGRGTYLFNPKNLASCAADGFRETRVVFFALLSYMIYWKPFPSSNNELHSLSPLTANRTLPLLPETKMMANITLLAHHPVRFLRKREIQFPGKVGI
jgi:hypothetical protein